MTVRWKLEVTQIGSTYSVEDIRRIIGGGLAISAGTIGEPVHQFNFDSAEAARAAEAAIAANTSGVHTRVEAFETTQP